ncbi:MAG: hypothetical protein HRU25_10605 [Psychrobium sp.]|nr:hypothetical protein [Psychrobium sp.]
MHFKSFVIVSNVKPSFGLVPCACTRRSGCYSHLYIIIKKGVAGVAEAPFGLLFGLVIETGCFAFFEYLSSNKEITGQVGLISYFSHVNMTLVVVSYALHLSAAVSKIARNIDDEHSLTV